MGIYLYFFMVILPCFCLHWVSIYEIPDLYFAREGDANTEKMLPSPLKRERSTSSHLVSLNEN